jgi:acetyl esterase/lipase
MCWNKRLLAVLLAFLVYGSLLPASEARADDIPAPERMTQTPVIPADLDYFPDQVVWRIDKDTTLKADVLMPKEGKGPHPGVLLFHGGGGVIGSRKTNLPIMIKLAQAGYVAVSVEYRLAPKYPFPAAIHDAKCAVRWLRANAEVYNVDTDQIAALGYSTGGQLASLLGLTTPLDGLEGEGPFPAYSSRVHVVISYYGIHDLKDWHKDGNLWARLSLNSCLGGSPEKVGDLYTKVSPATYARGDRAAFLLIHGTKDDLVPCKQSEGMEKRLKAAGAEVRLLPIEGAGHNFAGDAEKEADAVTIKYLDEMLRSKETVKASNPRTP